MSELERLHETLRRMHAAHNHTRFRVGRDWYLHAGFETRRAGEEYSWHGEKRGGDPRYPYFTWQYTLDGRGAWEENGQATAITPGTAFVMTVPSAHRYYLPRDSASWTFFWVTFRHDYIVPRLRDKLRESGSVLTIAPESRMVALAVSLCEIWRHGRGDAFAEEGALFEFLMEFERFVHTAAFEVDERERWLNEAREYVFRHLERSVDVDELAALYSMSRSYYAHRFKAATGRSPARWIQQVRLEEATRRLVHTDEKLDAVARGTGLHNANHFCKVFRRHFHLSPGEFRRQMR